MDDESLERLWALVASIVLLDANVAHGTVLLVDAVHVALASAVLLEEALGVLFGIGSSAGLFINDSSEFAMLHDIVINMRLGVAPVQNSEQHLESILDHPLAGAQEAQEQSIGVIMLDHAADGVADLVGGLASKVLLDELGAGLGAIGSGILDVGGDVGLGLVGAPSEKTSGATARLLGRLGLLGFVGGLFLVEDLVGGVVDGEEGVPELAELFLFTGGEGFNSSGGGRSHFCRLL